MPYRGISRVLRVLRARKVHVERSGGLVADADKAKKLLGWASQVDFDEGLARTIAWCRTAADRYNPSIYNV